MMPAIRLTPEGIGQAGSKPAENSVMCGPANHPLKLVADTRLAEAGRHWPNRRLGPPAPFWIMDAPAVPSRKLAQMRVGMTKEEVRQLLGSPRSDRGNAWQYSRTTWAILVIQFGPDERVTYFEHDY